MPTEPENPGQLPPDRPAAASSVQQLPALPGVDVDLALSRLGSNLLLYRQILAIFARSHAHAVEEISEALEARQYPVAFRLAHTMMGVTATLGASALTESFQELAAAIEAGDAVSAKRLLAFLAVPMASLVCAISTMV